MKKLTLVKPGHRKVQCEECLCPKEEPKPLLRTYQGDQCALSEAFGYLLDGEEMTAETLTALALAKLPKDFPDIPDIAATVEELVELANDYGMLRESSPTRSHAGRLRLVPNI